MKTHDERKWAALGFAAAMLVVAAGCGDDTDTGGNGGTPATGGGGTPSTGGNGGEPTVGGNGGEGGTGGMVETYACDDELDVESRGSAIALTDDDQRLLVTNRDAGSLSIIGLDLASGSPILDKQTEIPTGADSEPWSVVIDGCNRRAWVALRNENKVLVVDNLDNGPAVVAEIAVGAEPTGLALSPDNTTLYVSNWVEGTVSVVNTGDNTVTATVDLNKALIDTGYIGDVTDSRPALAHPRAIAANKDLVIVTEWFGQRIAPDGPNGANADVSKAGIVYRIDPADYTVQTIELPPVTDTGFDDHNGAPTGCFVNQVGSVTLHGNFAYVTSTCASPKGPLGVFTGTGPCTVVTQEQVCGVGGTCNANLQCNPNPTDVKASTHPALSVVNLNNDTATTAVLDALFKAPGVDSARIPHLPTDLAFFEENNAYITAMGTDAVFRVGIDAATGEITDVGSSNDFINLRVDASDTTIRNPVGIAIVDGADAFGFVSNDGSQDVTAVSFGTQTIAGLPDTPVIESSSVLPTGEALRRLRGKRFFNTGLGRWSLAGEGWGSCAACHVDGLTDNVTWYFGRGPRQSTSLDGSFASNDPTDQRVFNWTGIFDEVADFELNTRGTSGGLGAIVDASNARINLAAETPPQQGLSGSTQEVANPLSPNGEAPFGDPNSGHPHSSIDDWEEIKIYMQSIRSPRRPVGLAQADVDAGRAIFEGQGQGNCVACHSGAKWTISRVFWTVGDVGNSTLQSSEWLAEAQNAGFPADLLPVAQPTATNARMRFGDANNDQILCNIRPVGTFPASGTVGIGPTEVGVAEVRQNMSTLAQGGGTGGAEQIGRGFNVPSLLGVQVGAPYFHAGNARSLEELFDDDFFSGHHHSAVANVFTPSDEEKAQLIAYLLSIDEAEVENAPLIPVVGANGGDFCAPN
ncbi:MAG: hypothetical protein HOW73_25095 [Polyangiaceae bacterium]|nr:hypothetical protein [Polyangiaceae bacterium]